MEEKREEDNKQYLDVQRERMEFDERMELEGAVLELEKQHKLMKMELEKEKMMPLL